MEDSLVQFALTAFTTLLVVVDPFGVLPIFLSLSHDCTHAERVRIVTRAVLVGLVIAMLFLVAGHAMLAYLGVTVHAFAISGGILLFATALPMLFGHRSALQSPERDERDSVDMAVFPLAIPLLAGPGTITSVLLLTSQARGGATKIAIVAAALAVVFAITWLVLSVGGEMLVRRLGTSGLHVLTRVLGILLAALAVQYVLDGLRGYIGAL